MKHFASSRFWLCYERLPETIRKQADKSFALLKANPRHPSLKLKRIGKYYSVRIDLRYRALATEIKGGLLWFWIGNHGEYDELIS